MDNLTEKERRQHAYQAAVHISAAPRFKDVIQWLEGNPNAITQILCLANEYKRQSDARSHGGSRRTDKQLVAIRAAQAERVRQQRENREKREVVLDSEE